MFVMFSICNKVLFKLILSINFQKWAANQVGRRLSDVVPTTHFPLGMPKKNQKNIFHNFEKFRPTFLELVWNNTSVAMIIFEKNEIL